MFDRHHLFLICSIKVRLLLIKCTRTLCLGSEQISVGLDLLTLLLLLLFRDFLEIDRINVICLVSLKQLGVECEEGTAAENLHGLALTLTLRRGLGLLFLHPGLELILLLLRATHLPGCEALSRDRCLGVFEFERGTIFLDFLLERLGAGSCLVRGDLLSARVLLADDNEALWEHVAVIALHAVHGTDPTPAIQLVFNRIEEMFACNNGVMRHVFGALARVLVHVDLVLLRRTVNSDILDVLLTREDGGQQR